MQPMDLRVKRGQKILLYFRGNQAHTGASRTCAFLAAVLGLSVSSGAAFAADPIDKNYVKSLAAPSKKVLVIEYYDGNGEVTGRKGYTRADSWTAVSPTEFDATDGVRLKLFGLKPCTGDLVVKSENFAGTCEIYAKEALDTILRSAHVLFCRSFVSEAKAASQDTTCYGYYSIPGAMDSVDMLEEQLVSLGGLRLAKKADGSLARPELEQAETIGRKGHYGMWADPRVQAQ